MKVLLEARGFRWKGRGREDLGFSKFLNDLICASHHSLQLWLFASQACVCVCVGGVGLGGDQGWNGGGFFF